MLLWLPSPDGAVAHRSPLRPAEPGERPCRLVAPAGIGVRAASAAVAALLVATSPQGAEGSDLWSASTVPLVTVPFVSWAGWISADKFIWKVSSGVQEEAVETIKVVGLEARAVAETCGNEVRGWLVTAGITVRQFVQVMTLMLACVAVWKVMLWVSGKYLGPEWPCWPSPFAQPRKNRE